MFQREGRSRLPNASLSHVPLLIWVVWSLRQKNKP
jgi:hypothetical protein